MSIEIGRNVLQKLTHESSEIRLRTLEQIEGKILRALGHNEEIKFKPGELCKQLIRWFGYQPLQSPGKVLELLARVLRSKYGDEAVQRLGLERFKREIGKVQKLLGCRVEELQIVEEILIILQQHAKRLAPTEDDDIIELLNTLSIDDARSASIDTDNNNKHLLSERIICPPSDYELPWSKPSIADFNSMKFLADILINPQASSVELQNSLQHIQITAADYPAEYLLQAPDIYLNLLKLFEKADEMKCPLEDVAITLLGVLQLLAQRLQTRRRCITFAPPQHGSQALGKTQLKIEKALHLLLQAVIRHLQQFALEFGNETTYLFELILSALNIYRTLHLCVDNAMLQKLYMIASNLCEHSEQSENITLHRIKYILLSFLLQDMAENNASRQPLLHKDIFLPVLRDFPMRANFAQRNAKLTQLLCKFEPSMQHKEQQLKQYEEIFGIAMSLLKNPKCMNSSDVIAQNVDICIAVEKLDSVKLADLLFNAIVDCNVMYPANTSLRQQATQLLLRLLQLQREPLKTYVYNKLANAMKKHFACLMNGECYCAAMANAKLLACQIVGVPLSTALFQQLINDSQSTSGAQIQQYCIDLLCMLLKAQHLLAEHWCTLLEILLPTLPLLQACTHATKLVELLLKLYDPDAQNLPFLNILQGNIGFLFHSDAVIRNEAITRIIYILNSLETANQYVPNVMEISDLIPSDLCFLQPPRDYARIFAHSEVFSELSTLHNLLSLLDSANIEPLIRKTTLMQLNVMCQDWAMTAAFCEESAYFLVLRALENSMQKQSYEDYTDAAIPAIGILCKSLFYDSECRQQLANTANIYVLLLRALMLYQHDIQVRQDASICLMQLLYTNYMVVPGGKVVQLPSILSNLQLPLRCEFLDSSSSCAKHNDTYANIFSNNNEETTFLRFVLAASYCGGDEQLNQKYLVAQKQLEFCSSLQLTQREWRVWKATVPMHNLKRCLKVIANATEHRALINAATMLKLVLQLHEFDLVGVPTAEFDAELFDLLSKYLHLPPGNEMDFLLYERLLELCTQCMRLPLPALVAGISRALQADMQHAFLTLLKNPELPLRLFQKICHLLTQLLRSTDESVASATSVFYNNLYELLFNDAHAYFERRDLQRVRCLLTLLQACSMHTLDIPDKLLNYYCKRFLNLSIAIKAFTQTGAQWQRDCLTQICQLHAQMEEPDKVFKLNASCLKYLSGLCGHNDADVRFLAWRILSHAARFKSVELNDGSNIIDVLSYLPGGFLACCLSTLLDTSETIRVRQLAGELFATLLTHSDETLSLLDQHAFFPTAHESLSACLFDTMLPLHFDFESAAIVHFITCELVSVYCHICRTLLQQQPDYVQTLCEKPFMCKLYELLKLPPAHENPAYYDMVADICQLYCLCYDNNFAFLQRTLCRDQVWLVSFCQLLHQPQAQEPYIVQMLQLLLILSKDTTAYEKLCEKFAKMPEFISELFMRALDVPHLKTHLQQSALAVLTVLLTHSLPPLKSGQKTFAAMLERNVEITPREQLHNDNNNKENEREKHNNNNVNINRTSCAVITMKRKEPTNVPIHMRRLHRSSSTTIANARTKSPEKTAIPIMPSNQPQHTAAALIFHDLYRLFNHVYTTKACKFETAPSACTTQITDTLGALLKLSPCAQQSAAHLKLFERILRIFKIFFDETSMPCSTFVRRYGETRKRAILKNLQVLVKLLLNWQSSHTATITNDLHAFELTKVLIQIWPWLVHSSELKLLLLQLCDAVTKVSVLICQKFSTLISNYANSILQLIMKIVMFETTKVKAASSENFSIIQTCMHILINCCVCADSRASMVKERILDTFDGLYPFNPKAPKVKPDILHAWLQFWEVFCSHSDGGKLRNLNALCSIVQTWPQRSRTRLYALRILRNMCCLSSNRTQLMGSEEFLCTIYNVLAQPIEMEAECNVCYSYEEQLIATTAIQQLIAAGVKYVAMIRGSKLEKKFRILREHLQTLTDEDANHLQRCEYAAELMEKLEQLLKRFNSL